MKIARALAGTALLGTGLYLIAGEHLSGTSSDATVNARTSVLRAPIEGTVEFSVTSIGAKVFPEEAVARIEDQRFDNARLIDLERTRSALEVDRDRIARQIAAVAEARGVMQTQAADYQAGRIRQIETRHEQAKAQQASAEARLREAESALARTTDLSGRGLQTVITFDKAKADHEVARQELAGAKERVTFLSTEMNAARNGVFLGDSYNDAPYSIQRIREFDLKLADLAAESGAVTERLRQAEAQVNAERIRMNNLTSADLTTGAPGIVWNFLSASGEHVNKGQDLVRLVDCSKVMVTASVSETINATLQVGMPAQFRLQGDDRVFDATVTRLGGSGASGLYDNLAIGASSEHLTRFDVTLQVPGLAAHPDLACAVGRTGRVVFAGGPISAIRQFVGRFGF